MINSGDVAETKGDRQSVLIADFATRGDAPVSQELRVLLTEAVRRKIGEVLHTRGIESVIDPEDIASHLARALGSSLSPSKLEVLRRSLFTITREELADDEPHDVTRLLWMWDPKGNDRELEQQLFSAIEIELRRRVNGILRRSTFTGLRHKISQAELVSDLYLKLKKAGISFLPANRRQFYGLVDVAITNILRDLQKEAGAKMRPQSRLKEPLLDNHLDEGPNQDQLKMLLDAEEMLKLEENIQALDPQEQEIFRLRRNGMSVEEVAETIGCSVSTVKRDTAAAIEFLAKAQRAD